MKILWVLSKLTWEGGIGRAVSGAAIQLAKRGHEMHAAGPAPDNRSPEPLLGVSHHASTRPQLKLGRLRSLFALARVLRPDVIHFHSAVPHGELILGCRLLRRAWGGSALVVTPHTGSRAGYPKLRSRIGLRAADLVIAPSQWSAGKAVHAGAPADRTRVVYAGIDTPPVGPAAQRERVILAMAKFVENKGIDRVIAAFDKMVRDRPQGSSGWRLEIAGAGREESKLRDLASRSEAADRIRFLGYLRGEDKIAALARASIGVVASSVESFGGVLLELQAHGVAVIASNTGGIPELSDGGKAARLVPAGDVEALAAALGEWVADEPARKLAAENAHRFGQRFSWGATAEAYEALYTALRTAR
ncbi:MAG: glycosyltransferase family 4 protein [Myxococcales bacterium]|nr:glycosyltransferase family 4 protein [Myxococcales bacterium]